MTETTSNTTNSPADTPAPRSFPDLTKVRFRPSHMTEAELDFVEIRLKRNYSEILVQAFTEARDLFRQHGRGDYVARYQQLLDALPRTVPYFYIIYPKDWGFISYALRLGGESPSAGSDHARARALYSTLARQVPYRVK